MQGTYNYIPKINHVSKLYNVAAVLYLQFVPHVMLFPVLNVLFFYNSTSRSIRMCSAQYGCCCSSLISCFPVMLLRYSLSNLGMIPFAPVFTLSLQFFYVPHALYF